MIKSLYAFIILRYCKAQLEKKSSFFMAKSGESIPYIPLQGLCLSQLSEIEFVVPKCSREVKPPWSQESRGWW